MGGSRNRNFPSKTQIQPLADSRTAFSAPSVTANQIKNDNGNEQNDNGACRLHNDGNAVEAQWLKSKHAS